MAVNTDKFEIKSSKLLNFYKKKIGTNYLLIKSLIEPVVNTKWTKHEYPCICVFMHENMVWCYWYLHPDIKSNDHLLKCSCILIVRIRKIK